MMHDRVTSGNLSIAEGCAAVEKCERTVGETLERQIAWHQHEIERLRRATEYMRTGDLLKLSTDDFRRLLNF
jgi:hypothetical protein